MAHSSTSLEDLQPDLIALQEVGEGLFLPGDPVSILNEGLKYHSHVFWLRSLPGFKTGLAILSKHPIETATGYMFSSNLFIDKKGALLAVIKAPGGKVNFWNIHLDSDNNHDIRSRQMEELAGIFNSVPASNMRIIAGDFNEENGSPLFQQLKTSLGAKSLFDWRSELKGKSTWTAHYPAACDSPGGMAIDNILVRAMDKDSARQKIFFKHAGIVSTKNILPISDHCIVWAEIETTLH